jgi:hypothetical protein
MLKHLATRRPAPRRRPRRLLLERLRNRLCLSTRSQRVIKRHLFLGTLLAGDVEVAVTAKRHAPGVVQPAAAGFDNAPRKARSLRCSHPRS